MRNKHSYTFVDQANDLIAQYIGKLPAANQAFLFEMNTLIQSAQTLSREIDIEKFIPALMQLLSTHSNADKSYLILAKEKKLVVGGELIRGQKGPILLPNLLLEQKQDELSVAVVKNVALSKKAIFLDHPPKESSLTEASHKPGENTQSIWCMPLVDQDILTGIIYLENIKEPFLPTIHLLSLISNQIAISIENAYLYSNLKKEVLERNERIKEIQGEHIHHDSLITLNLMMAGIAHDIKNPINFIINLSSLSNDLIVEFRELVTKYIEDLKNSNQIELENDLINIQEILDLLTKNNLSINQQGRNANNIIQSMQAHLKYSTETKVLTDINQMVENFLDVFSKDVGLQYPQLIYTIDKELDPKLKKGTIIQQDIERVLLNMLNNAYYSLNKKQGQNGSEYHPVLRLKTQDLGDCFKISVSDNGLGIPEKLKEKIFTLFFTTKGPSEGTGLGLPLSLNIVREHRGELTFETKEGEFAEFTITLPYI